jgi:hypothetical protein
MGELYSYQLLKQEGRTVVFSLPSYSSLTLGTFSRIQNDFSNYNELVFRPESPDFDDLKSLDQTLPPNMFCQIGFTASKLKPPTGPQEKIAAIISRPPSSNAELKFSLAKTFFESFAEDWIQYIGKDLTERNFESLLSLSRPEKTLLLFCEEKQVGMISLFSSEDCLGTPLQQISWIWIDSHLESAERATVHFLIYEWLEENNNTGTYQAGVHLKNERSQRFFQKFGFKPVCIHCLPR